MSREWFVEELIAELKRQREAEQAAKSQGVARAGDVEDEFGAYEIHRKLSFDFPLVQPAELKPLISFLDGSLAPRVLTASHALTHAIELESPTAPVRFRLYSKCMENLNSWVNEVSPNNQGSQITSLCSQIMATLFLKLPAHMLLCSQHRLSELFKLPHEAEEPLPWTEIVHRLREFLTSSTISAISSAGSAILLRGGHIQAVIMAISVLNPLSRLSEVSEWSEELSLLRIVHSIHTNEPIESLPLQPQEALELSENLRAIWQHLLFLCRDIFCIFPEVFLSAGVELLSSIIAGEGSGSRGSSSVSSASSSIGEEEDYPSAIECIFVLLVSNLCSEFTSTFTSIVEGAAANRKAARQLLRDFLSENLAHYVDICDRMRRLSSDNGVEACNLLISCAWLFIIVEDSPIFDANLLLESRMLAVMIQIWIAWNKPASKVLSFNISS